MTFRMTPLDTVLEEEIEKVDMKSKSSSFHKTKEAGRCISDNHQQNLSFSNVRPAEISVRNLGVEVDTVASFVDTLKAKFTKGRVDDVESGGVGRVRRKKILKHVSAEFPAGTLTAIIGASGSGKVGLRLITIPRI
jgi:ABC-type multidrug transport system fused ATPase/permease subunit